MMNLNTQIITFIFSITFGFIFTSLISIVYKNKLFNILLTFFVVIISALLYFVILLKLNNAIIHPFYIFAFIIGFILENCLKRLVKKIVLLLKK